MKLSDCEVNVHGLKLRDATLGIGEFLKPNFDIVEQQPYSDCVSRETG